MAEYHRKEKGVMTNDPWGKELSSTKEKNLGGGSVKSV